MGIAAALSLSLLLAGRMLYRKSSHVFQAGGILCCTIAGVIFLLEAEVVRQFGIAWHRDRLLGVSRVADVSFLATWALCGVGVLLSTGPARKTVAQ
jgi:uncharacterized membrane protein